MRRFLFARWTAAALFGFAGSGSSPLLAEPPSGEAEHYQLGTVALEVFQAPGGHKVFLTAIRRDEGKPEETLCAGVEAGGQSPWQFTPDAARRGAELRVPPGGKLANGAPASTLAGVYERWPAERRLQWARARAAAADAALNQAYGETKNKLPASAAAALRDSQREWLRFVYELNGEVKPNAPGLNVDEWEARAEKAALRALEIRALGQSSAPEDAASLRAQLAAAEDAEAWPATAELARRLLIAAPRDGELWEKRANALVQAEDWPQASAALDAWARAIPKPAARLEALRGQVALGLEDSDGAIRAWTAFLKLEPKSPEIRDQLATELMKKGQYPAAISVLELRVKLEPTAAAWARLSICHANLREWKKMSATIRRGNALDEADEAVKKTYPRVERLEKELPALGALEALAAAHQRDVNPPLERALIFQTAGWPMLALQETSRARELDPTSRRALLQHAAALREMDREEEADALEVPGQKGDQPDLPALRALGDADFLLRQHQGDATTLLTRRAQWLNRLKRFALALADAEAALKLSGEKNDEALVAQGDALIGLEREWEGLQVTQRAVALNPKNGPGWCSIAGVYAQFRRPDEALSAVEKALQLDPSDVLAMRLRKTIHESTSPRP